MMYVPYLFHPCILMTEITTLCQTKHKAAVFESDRFVLWVFSVFKYVTVAIYPKKRMRMIYKITLEVVIFFSLKNKQKHISKRR